MKTKVLTILFCVLFLYPLAAKADFNWSSVGACDPVFLRVTYADADASTSMGVAWNTKEECQTVVEYGESLAYGQTATGKTFKANGALNWVHEVLIENLKPNTTYHYRVGDGSKFSDDKTFVTAPPPSALCPEFVFAFAGDSRADTDGVGPSEKWDDIVTEALNDSRAAFVLNGGDLVKNGGSDKEWLNYLVGTPDLMALYPVMPVLGNHDDGPGQGDGANYNQVFNLPRNPKTGTEDYYYFRYGNTLIVGLDTVNYTDFKAQSEWVDEIMAEHSDVTWKIAIFHHPVYTSAGIDVFGLEVGHPPNEVGQNETYVKMFDKHSFDLAIGSHNHYYERFSPSFGGYGKEANPVSSPEEGTIYMVSGGGGAITFQDMGVKAICGYLAAKGSEACSGKHHYIKFEIKGYSLKMETWETTQQTISSDPKNRKKIDELVINKPFQGVDPCTLPPADDDDDVSDAGAGMDISMGEDVEEEDAADSGDDDDEDVSDGGDMELPDEEDGGYTDVSDEETGNDDDAPVIEDAGEKDQNSPPKEEDNGSDDVSDSKDSSDQDDGTPSAEENKGSVSSEEASGCSCRARN